MREVAAELPKEAPAASQLPATSCQLLGEAGANTEVTEVTEVNSKDKIRDGILRESVLRPPDIFGPPQGF